MKTIRRLFGCIELEDDKDNSSNAIRYTEDKDDDYLFENNVMPNTLIKDCILL